MALHAVTGTQGGPRTYAMCLLRALVDVGGDELTLVSDDREPPADLGEVRSVRIPVPARALRPLVESVALPWTARRIGCEVFHGTKQTLPAAIPCARVVTIHDLAPMLFPQTFPRGAGSWLRSSTRAAARRAHRVIAVSETTARDLRERLDVPEEKLRVVPHGIEPRFLGPHDPARIADMRTRYGLPERYLASIGTIQPRKNLDVVLDAVERLARRGRDVPKLVIAGRNGWMSDEVVRRARSSPGVVHLGTVPEEDLPLLHAGATLFLSPSSYEGFGLAVAEAMAAGVAVVAGRGSASDEVVADAGVLVPPRDVEALSAAIDALLSDETRRRALAAAGRERIARFTWQETARATREVYREALECSR